MLYLYVRLFGKLDIISRRLFIIEMIHLANYNTILEMPIIEKIKEGEGQRFDLL